MHFFLTKKLLKKFRNAEKTTNEANSTVQFNAHLEEEKPLSPFYCWHGNVFEIDQNECVVLTNDSHGLTLIFLNPYDEDYNEFGDHISEALDRTMQRLGFSDQSTHLFFAAFENYSASAGKDLTLIGKNIASAQRVKDYAYLLNDDDCFQDAWSFEVNTLYAGKRKSTNALGLFKYQCHEHLTALKLNIWMAEIEVRLKLTGQNDIIRIIDIPMHVSYKALHSIIQTVFMWENNHRHQFIMEDGLQLTDSEQLYLARQLYYDIEEDSEPEEAYLLADLIGYDDNRHFSYVYDFGDYWEHQVYVRRMWTQETPAQPKLKMMIGDPVPEDIGGEAGYAYFMEALSSPDHTDHEQFALWNKAFSKKKQLFNSVDVLNSRLSTFGLG
ncbi:plasmid pRiA4b ORF-3 family protein [Alkalibacterium sp. AK22]|uniref:plasmid pRiA4b ORF-3 family protein n=1 Tax=Alkalibacterium sp. AK22 TaxID=1229520 RepID=UPI00044B4784|nr:plasmid pRiA4b ORF-3 family protein [Alkalibacterium sp. AK22]EXJ23731.1 plasmid pRiA4b ORF-3 family protein [Alkalibacterium sp. AK22]